MTKRAPRFPTITVSLGVLALALWLIPGANAVLQLERTAIAAGEFWRLITGHLTHWTASHLGWDLAAFALLGTLIERRSRRLLVATLATSALAISAAVWFFEPDLATYRGLSGVDSALFATWAMLVVRQAIHAHRRRTALWIGIASVGFAAKTVVESLADATVFVAAHPLFVPVPLAHVAGAVAGLLAALAYSSIANAAHVVAAWPCGSPTGRLRSM